ncbi:MAG: hypothetical protein ACLUD2_17240 [Clostridium sp.]
MAKETLASMLDDFINEQLDQIVLSNPAEKDHLLKVKVRPMLMKGALVFQAEEFTRTQAFHKNMSAGRTEGLPDGSAFRQLQTGRGVVRAWKCHGFSQ